MPLPVRIWLVHVSRWCVEWMLFLLIDTPFLLCCGVYPLGLGPRPFPCYTEAWTLKSLSPANFLTKDLLSIYVDLGIRHPIQTMNPRDLASKLIGIWAGWRSWIHQAWTSLVRTGCLPIQMFALCRVDAVVNMFQTFPSFKWVSRCLLFHI